MPQNGFQLGSKIQIASGMRDVQRLDADPIAGQHEASIALRPERHREHAAQSREARRIPLQEGLQDDFRIAMGPEPAAELLQFVSKLAVIVNFPVKNNCAIAVFAINGLIPALQIDDFQADGPERNEGRFMRALLVGSAMDQGARDACDAPLFGRMINVGESRYTAH
jgi:hypothetical protein